MATPNGVRAGYHSTAEAILAFIPRAEQSKFLEPLLQSLSPEDYSSVEFAASLIDSQPDQYIRRMLLDFLEEAIGNGNVQCAVSVSKKHPKIGNDMLVNMKDKISQAKYRVEKNPYEQDAIQFYLHFTKLIMSHLPSCSQNSALLEECLNLLDCSRIELCVSAGDVVFAYLTASGQNGEHSATGLHSNQIWDRVQRLITTRDSQRHVMLGYTLWLRWMLSEPGKELNILIKDDWWQFLLEDLRRGDSERRKICLSILKLSVATDVTGITDDLRQIFTRYCIVFETIVLGRYINQVQECDNDLNVLATITSIGPRWLYTLLSSALDKQMQDSNRRFIGNWVMQSDLHTSKEFCDFFQNDFLPWAIEGHLFVSSLRRTEGNVQCLHGDRLSHFIWGLTQAHDESWELIDIIVDTIHRKRYSMFAYATVYLLEGIESGLQERHAAKLSELSGLPEVARDYVLCKTAKLITSSDGHMTQSRNRTMEQEAIEKCHAFNPVNGDLDDIWGDLEHLEYPKNLLLEIPKLLLNQQLIQRASKCPDLATSISGKLHDLHGIAETKTFVFSPLMCVLREAVATTPEIIDVFNIPEFIVRIAERPPQPTVDLMLEEATTHLTPYTYQHYFGYPLGHGYAAFLDLVSRIRMHESVLKAIILHIMHLWKAQKVPPPSVSTWKTPLQLQILLLCFEQYWSIAPKGQYWSPAPKVVLDLLDDLLYILSIEPLPTYRYLLEMCVFSFVQQREIHEAFLQKLQREDHHSNPKHLASLMKVGVALAGHPLQCDHVGPCTEDCGEDLDLSDFALQLATAMIPLAASSKIVIRHEAQWQFPILMDLARVKSWITITDNPAFMSLDRYIRSLERFNEPPWERQIGHFNPDTDNNFTNLVEGKWMGLDSTVTPFTSRIDFVGLWEGDKLPWYTKDWPVPAMELGDPRKRPQATQSKPAQPSTGPRTTDEVSALQTKGTAYLARTLSDTFSIPSRPNNVIVVGSLVHNPHNQGGLSRVSEIFSASALTLQNPNVLNNKDFTSVSVSSHLHFPIVQLSESGIPAFLSERKEEGFTVVGIEQTDRSVILGSEDAKLPEKVVLVVGSEREGVPAVVLTECDILVEIPQQGITRSLNVQTAVSIVLYEHARQHKKSAA